MTRDPFNEFEPEVVEYIKSAVLRMQADTALAGQPMTQDELIETVCLMCANPDVIKREMSNAKQAIQATETPRSEVTE